MELDVFVQAGLWFRSIILTGSDLLREEWTPGLVSLVLFALAGVIFVKLFLRDRARLSALNWADRTVKQATDREDFAKKFLDIHREFVAARDTAARSFPRGGVRHYRRSIAVAWGEYAETMVLPDETAGGVVKNSLRPGIFFDAEDLGFEPGWWRIWPGLFVSVGLLLTFLGLIAALTAIGGDEITDDSMRELLNAASAKFIMSLTGLACSIALTVAGRFSTRAVEHRIRELCHAIEKRLRFQSLEDLAAAQLEATREQGTAMRQVATEMVAELARPLHEELPAAIGRSIQTEMAPLVERLGQTSEQGLGAMVGDLSARLSSDVGAALSDASERLSEAADRLANLSEGMASGTGRIGAEYESLAARMGEQLGAMQAAMQEEFGRGQQAMSDGVERLMQQMTESLDAIRANTSDGAQAIAAAAADMRSAAEGFRSEIETATGSGAQAVSAEMARAAEAAGSSIATATAGLTTPLSDLADRLQSAAEATRGSAEQFSRLATAAENGGLAITRGSERFEQAAVSMAGAAAPIRDGINGLESTTRDVAKTVTATAQTAQDTVRQTAQQTRDAIDLVTEILGDQRRGIADAMEGLAVALRELKGHGEQLDSIDQKLGAAFETYRAQVEATMSGTADQVSKIVETLNPALDTMRSVVEQAEEFAPQASRRAGG